MLYVIDKVTDIMYDDFYIRYCKMKYPTLVTKNPFFNKILSKYIAKSNHNQLRKWKTYVCMEKVLVVHLPNDKSQHIWNENL